MLTGIYGGKKGSELQGSLGAEYNYRVLGGSAA
jgi:hypothetical protein